ncbi:BON domain-containing protein [Azospirillum soli]|uniref:BON domain-containing protein n=1 Tax=Azospirillum soli TaxID=1304799 RepID=UPI001FE7D383|nr:BON domain-containing protein [Azospirillum soli]MBP2315611.1 osmotically-inducible protein OsmY [Azospirillum soli]
MADFENRRDDRWRAGQRQRQPGYGYEGYGREGYDYGREYWRQPEDMRGSAQDFGRFSMGHPGKSEPPPRGDMGRDMEMSGGQHRGRGPRGYTRSDDRIRKDVNDLLTDDPYIDASDIEVTVANCEVTLSGMVDHRVTRRRVEDLVDSVPGVTHVQNDLRVAQPSAGMGGGMGGGGTSAGASAMAGLGTQNAGTTGTGAAGTTGTPQPTATSRR